MLIKVLGPGCAKCKETEKIVTLAVEQAGNGATVEKVTDFKEMMKLGVMSTPAVVIDGRIMCTGRVPALSEVENWISEPKHTGSGPIPGCSCGGKC